MGPARSASPELFRLWRLRGRRSLHVTDGHHPNMQRWWVPALTIGSEHTFIHQVADFLQGLAGDKPASASFRDAMATDFVTDAALPSAQLGRWEKVQS
jgi:hypothetical protein